MHAHSYRRNAKFSSQISVEPADRDSEQLRVGTAHCALLADTAIRGHIIVRESVAMSIDVRSVYQA